METMELKHGSEVFNSPMMLGRSETAFNDIIMNNSLTGMFEESLLSAELFNELGDHGGVTDEDRIIDIETIDELSGIMESPDRMMRFSSLANSALQLTSQQLPAVTCSGSNYKQTSALVTKAMVSERKRHDSELMMVELVSLQDQMYVEAAAGSQGQQDDESFTMKLEDDDFSLLTIDGIEAEDLETLIQQFEGATKSSVPSPVKQKIASPVLSLKSKRPPLTLEGYRKKRGINTATNNKLNPAVRKIGFDVRESGKNSGREVATPSQNPPANNISQAHHTQAVPGVSRRQSMPSVHVGVAQPAAAKSSKGSSTLHRSSSSHVPLDRLKAMPLPLKQPLSELYNRRALEETAKAQRAKAVSKVVPQDQVVPDNLVAPKSQAEIIEAIKLDHICYCKPLPDRNIKAELTMLLQKIPEYISNSSSQCQAPSNDRKPSADCRCDTEKAKISPDSSAHKTSSKVEKSVELPKAYILPTRGRPRKANYRRRSPSSCQSSSSSSYSSSSSSEYSEDSDSSSCSSCDSCSSCCSPTRDAYRKRSSTNSRKRRRKSGRRQNRKHSRMSSHSRSTRGRHKKSTQSRRKRHKSSRSSRSVSPHSYPTSSTSRSPSPNSSDIAARRRKAAEEAHAKAMAERRVVYVGGIDTNYSKADLKKRFGGFGEIENVKTHLREDAENYGFVTFYSKADAYAAVEKGNDVYGPKFNLGFGGRRIFCSTEYADLDGCQAVKEEWAPSMRSKNSADDDFDKLLKQSIKKMK